MKSSKAMAVLFLIISGLFPPLVTGEESCPVNQECHYEKSCILRALGVGTSTACFVPMAIGWSLGLVGFGPLGPIIGSVAAAWQSKIGIVAAGSLFATLQSAAMAGVSKTVILGLVSTAVFAACPCKCENHEIIKTGHS